MGADRDVAHQGASAANGRPAVVVARGPLPYGRHYELVAFRPAPSVGTPPDSVCFELDFPEVLALGTMTCTLPATGTSVAAPDTGTNASATRAFGYAAGLTGGDVR
jgi:hypothetical protein